MEKLKSHAASPSKGNDITALAGKLKRVALNMPVWFSTQARRPHSKSTARFGSLSHHAFFSRHNPHPHRVTHIQGKSPFRGCSFAAFLELPLPSHTGSLSEAWREELRELAARVRAASSTGTEKKETTEKSQRETQYSEETGRLIPLSSRATTRHSSHCLRKNNARNKGKDAILSFQGQELIILELLCQILQTDSLMAIQQWLLTASQKDPTSALYAIAWLSDLPQSLISFPSQKGTLEQNHVASGNGFAAWYADPTSILHSGSWTSCLSFNLMSFSSEK
uniref:Uncharacterized protein n=1 Tax=Varanus komodoensis TaxID=61221 RepID=A0A8D2IWY4_VARKO